MIRKAGVACVLGLLLLWPLSGRAEERGGAACLTYRVETAKQRFALGEPVQVRVSWRNLCGAALQIESWRGPLAGVAELGNGELDFGVFAIDGARRTRLRYQGMYVDSSRRAYLGIAAHGRLERSYVLNAWLLSFFTPVARTYDLDRPGTYEITSTYQSSSSPGRKDVWVGKLPAPPVRVEVVTLPPEELALVRRRLDGGELVAASIVASHRDERAIAGLIRLAASKDRSKRAHAYMALAHMRTAASTDALGRAVVAEPDPLYRAGGANLLGGTRNPAAIPHLRKLVQDVSSDGEVEHDGKRFKVLTVRKWAVAALARLGVQVKLPYELEIGRARPRP